MSVKLIYELNYKSLKIHFQVSGELQRLLLNIIIIYESNHRCVFTMLSNYLRKWLWSHFLIKRRWTFGQTNNDVMDLLKYCENAKKSCLKFQYSYTLDEEKRLDIFFGHLFLILIGIKNMVMLLYLILHTR